ncbi:MAG TPA: transglutaminase domain-containing protein [Hanamia sp.]|nr:transglutaminase domain-containing protein [Hanamia sp.]
MKLALVLIILFLVTQFVVAQDHFAAERIYVNIPKSQTNSSAGIAAYINSHFDSDDKKVAAIYSWITANIRYDADTIHYVILDEDNEERVSWALKRKKGVCENFAAIFTDVATQCGINSFVVEGYTKQSGTVDHTPHVWCVAYVNNKWELFDPTWDAGRVDVTNFDPHYNFFNASPEEFVNTHLPFDPVFQLLNYPINYKDFVRGNTSENKQKAFVNFNDSLEAMINLDRLSRYAVEKARIENAEWPADKIDMKVRRINFQMEILNQDTDVDLYNGAVADINKAVSVLNTFLTYRNNNFQPGKSPEEVQFIFYDVQQLIANGDDKIKRLKASKATLQLETADLETKLENLKNNLDQQKSFYKNYVASASGEEK